MIHPQAIVDAKARIASDVHIGPWSIIGADVEIDTGTWIGPHVLIKGHTKIGKNNKFFQFSSIGEEPQDKKYAGEETYLNIGDNNIVREFCTLNRGTAQGGGVTNVGSYNLFMAYTHIAHDCQVGNHTILANSVSLGGHVVVQDYAIIGGLAGIHQFCQLGASSFVAKGSMIDKDVLPYVLVAGNSASVYGLNIVGLKRRNFSAETIQLLQRAYKIIYRNDLTVQEAIPQLQQMLTDCPEVQQLIDFLQQATRGIVR
jgi:UDP-N-acetylglucosamine acyltransferase